MGTTFGGFTEKLASKYGDKVAIVFRGEELTYRELDNFSDRIMLFYLGNGISKGIHVGLLASNSAEWVIHYLALCKLGAVAVLFNTHLTGEELAKALNYADVTYLTCGDRAEKAEFKVCLDKINRESAPMLKRIFHIGHELGPLLMNYKEPSDLEAEYLRGRKASVDPADPVNLIFTSGTIAKPKGVLTSGYQMLTAAAEAARHMRLGPETRICSVLPLYHCYGLSVDLLAGLTAGGTIYILEAFRSADVLECIEKNKCTVFNGVTTMFLAMMRHENRMNYKISSLITGTVAGSYVSPNEFMEISRNFSIPHLQMSYGQTEATAGITFSGFDESLESKSHHVGKPIEGTSLRISGAEGLPGISGEIEIKGFNVMKGYYRMKDESEKTFTDDGWMKTGDLGMLDEDGNLHITGRVKELIIRCGENISPVEVETCIRNYPGIEDVKVIGVPAEVIQEKVVACIILRKGWRINEQLLINHMRKHLAQFKIPESIEYFSEFPIGRTGKVNTGELKKMVIGTLEKV
jgi:fatty-acyl-CoA synthase